MRSIVDDKDNCPVCNPQPKRARTARLSISVPGELAAFARARAAARGVTVSLIVAEALSHDRHIREAARVEP